MIKRYQLECIDWDRDEMVEDNDGDYVKYDDIKHLLEQSQNTDYAKCIHTKSCKYHNSVLLPVIADKTMV